MNVHPTPVVAVPGPEVAESLQQAAWSRPLRCVDHVYRGKDYRLAEPDRRAGASVRIVGALAGCCACGKVLNPARHAVRLPDRVRWLCIPDAIARTALVPMEARKL